MKVNSFALQILKPYVEPCCIWIGDG